MFDDANVRILVINMTGSVGGFVSPYSMAEGTRIGGTVGDGRRWLYAEQRATSASDSVTIFRWRIGAQAADRVVRMHRPLVRSASALGNGAVRPWSQRTTFGREGARYDLVGPDGNLVDRVRLPEGHRVIGFGGDAIYVVRRNEDDIEFLQRRPLPR